MGIKGRNGKMEEQVGRKKEEEEAKAFLVTIRVEREVEVLEEETEEEAIAHVRNNLNFDINEDDYVIESGG